MRIRDYISRYPWLIPTLFFSILVVVGSLMHPLWGDEAETALFARNILRFGLPVGWDGTNLMGLNEATVLNKALLNHSSPWAQYYLSAISMGIFGQSSFTARLPFILLSILSLPCMYLLVLKMTKNKLTALLTVLIMATSVPFILFSFQARYYSLAGICRILLVLALLYLPVGRIWAKALFVFIGVVFFHANYLVFACFALSLMFCYTGYLWAQKKSWKVVRRFLFEYIGLGLVIGLLTVPWYVIMQPTGGRGGFAIPPLTSDTLSYFLQLFLATLAEYNLSNAFPVLFLPILLVIVLYEIKKKQPVRNYLFPLALPALSILLITMVTMFSTSGINFAAVRYSYMVFPFLAFTSAMILTFLWRKNKWLGLGVLAIYLLTNLFTLLPFRSFPMQFLGEVMHPYKTPDKVVADYLQANAKDGDTAFVTLDRDHEALIFHLHDKIRFVNRVSRDNPLLFPENYGVLPEYIYNFQEPPDWVIVYGKLGYDGSFLTSDYRQVPIWLDLQHGYTETVLPVYFADMSRPEIGWRSFTEVKPRPEEQVFIFHKR